MYNECNDVSVIIKYIDMSAQYDNDVSTMLSAIV
jgi:hypothetical protein